MAHVEKFKSAAVGNMMHHYRRDREATLERDNIDRSRTHLNYTLGPDGGLERIHARVEEVEATMTRSVRSDAVVMCDWVVTAPPDLKEEDTKKFFESTYDFVSERYGAENMLGGYVHLDETTPHIHIALTPVVERDGGKLAFSAKDVFNRQELLRFHGELSNRIERDLGYRTQIELATERTLERALSRAGSLEEYQKAKDGLERLRQDERSALERNQELGGRAEELRREIGERQEEIGREEVRQREIEETYRARETKAEELSREVGSARERVGQLERSLELVKEKVREFGDGLERLRGLAREQIERVRGFFGDRFQARDAERDFDRAREAFRKCSEDRETYERSYVECSKCEQRIGTLAHELEHDEDRLKQIERDVERERQLADRCQARLERLEEHKLRNRGEIPKAQADLEHHRESQERLEQQRNELERSIGDKTRELCQAEWNLEYARSAVDVSRENLEASRSFACQGYDRLEPSRQREFEEKLEHGRDELRDLLKSRGLDLEERNLERSRERAEERTSSIERLRAQVNQEREKEPEMERGRERSREHEVSRADKEQQRDAERAHEPERERSHDVEHDFDHQRDLETERRIERLRAKNLEVRQAREATRERERTAERSPERANEREAGGKQHERLDGRERAPERSLEQDRQQGAVRDPQIEHNAPQIEHEREIGYDRGMDMDFRGR